jgi:hypothetical protein
MAAIRNRARNACAEARPGQNQLHLYGKAHILEVQVLTLRFRARVRVLGG